MSRGPPRALSPALSGSGLARPHGLRWPRVSSLVSRPGSQGAAAHGPLLGSLLRCSQVLPAGGFPAGEGLGLLHPGLRLLCPGLTCLALSPVRSRVRTQRVPSALLLSGLDRC